MSSSSSNNNSQDISQKRRQKILARLSKQQELELKQQHEQQEKQSNVNVYDRYKMIKIRQQTQKQLVLMSRMAGLVIVTLSYVVSPWIGFVVVDGLLIAGAILLLSGEREADGNGKGKKDTFLDKLPFLSKLKHLKLITLILKIIINSIFSFILVAVLLNASLVHLSTNYLSINHSQSTINNQMHVQNKPSHQPAGEIEIEVASGEVPLSQATLQATKEQIVFQDQGREQGEERRQL